MANIYSGPLSPDKFQTTTSYGGLGSIGVPGVGGIGLPDVSGLIKRRMEQEDADRAAAARLQRMAEMRQIEQDQQMAAMRGAGGPRLKMGTPEGDLGRRAQLQSMNQASYQDQLARQGPPLRVVQGAGIIPGYTMDTNAMNAYQRQMYLPGSSSAQFQTGLSGAAQAQDLQNQFNQMRLMQARKQVEREGGF